MAVSKSIAVWAKDLSVNDNVKTTIILIPDDDNDSCSAVSGWIVWSGQTF